MAWRADLEMTQILETGCNNRKKGFTLIEILVVIIVIGIASSLIFLNLNSVVSVNKNQSTFIKSFGYVVEESIISGNIVGWHANNDSQFFYFLDTNNDISKEIKNPYSSNWENLYNYKKTFKSYDGSEFDFEYYYEDKPLIIFYPSGESTGGYINIFFDEYIQKIEIKTNGKITSQVVDY